MPGNYLAQTHTVIRNEGVARDHRAAGTPQNTKVPRVPDVRMSLAPSRAAVDKTYATALEHGATDEGAPGLRPHYHPNYYGAYFRDLDGNKLCMCCHD